MKKNAQVIAFFNHKGGPGKTTLTSLSANDQAYERGKGVLVVDADNFQKSFYDAREAEKLDAEQGILSLPENLYPITIERPTEIQTLLETERDNYDLIYIDLGGSTGLDGVITALTEVDRLIVPVVKSDTALASTIRFIDGPLFKIYQYWLANRAPSDLPKIGFLLNDVTKRAYNSKLATKEHTEEVAEFLQIDKVGGIMFENVVYREESELRDNFQTHQTYYIKKDPARYDALYNEINQFINS